MNPIEQPRIDPSAAHKILLIRLRRIGDVVMTTPAVTALKKAFPRAELTYIVEDPYRELVEGNPNLEAVLVLPKKQGRKDFLRFLRRIRKDRYDVVIDFHGGPRASLITFVSGARLKIGYKIKYKSFIYDIKIPRKPKEGDLHSVENHINLVKALGVGIESFPPLHLPPAKKKESDKISSFLTENNSRGKKIIVLHIGAGNAFRDWGLDNLSALMALFSGLPDIQVVLVGNEEDIPSAREILKKSGPHALSLVGKLSLRELKELIALSSLFVGPDSGPMHMAAATSTPIVAYFGPTLPAHFAPWQAQAALLEKPLDCRPCRQRTCQFDDFRCLRSITPEEVYQACLKFIGSLPFCVD